jgi:hypothetical protein
MERHKGNKAKRQQGKTAARCTLQAVSQRQQGNKAKRQRGNKAKRHKGSEEKQPHAARCTL